MLADPAANAVAGAVLVFSFYVNGASFLAYAAIAEKRKLATDARGPKSLFFTTGLAEATETIAVFCRLLPVAAWFPDHRLRLRGADLLHRAVADRAGAGRSAEANSDRRSE